MQQHAVDSRCAVFDPTTTATRSVHSLAAKIERSERLFQEGKGPMGVFETERHKVRLSTTLLCSSDVPPDLPERDSPSYDFCYLCGLGNVQLPSTWRGAVLRGSRRVSGVHTRRQALRKLRGPCWPKTRLESMYGLSHSRLLRESINTRLRAHQIESDILPYL